MKRKSFASHWSEEQRKATLHVPSASPTAAGARFFEQYQSDLDWLLGQHHIKRELDSVVETASSLFEALGEISGAPPVAGRTAEEMMEIAANSLRSRLREIDADIDRNDKVGTDVGLCRFVDNFLCYVSDLMRLVMSKFPSALGDAKVEVTSDELFSQDVESLRELWIERKVQGLSLGGTADLEKYLDRRHGFELLDRSERSRVIKLAFALRNVIVHNRGYVDSKFAKLAGGKDAEYLEFVPSHGERVSVYHSLYSSFAPALVEAVHSIDRRAAETFGFESAEVARRTTQGRSQEMKLMMEVADSITGERRIRKWDI